MNLTSKFSAPTFKISNDTEYPNMNLTLVVNITGEYTYNVSNKTNKTYTKSALVTVVLDDLS